MNKKLLVVDLQKQFKDSNDKNRCYSKCLNYVKEHCEEYSSIVATLFNQNESTFNGQADFNRDEHKNVSASDLEFYDHIENITVITKNGYGIPTELYHSFFIKDDQIDIIGCDADTSIMAICFQLWDAGFRNIRILTDYIYTTADYLYGVTRKTWINALRRAFGDCVIIPKRRISFDATFIAPGKTIEYKGEVYEADIALYFEYVLVTGDGEEVYMEADVPYIGTPPCVFSIDKEHGYKMEYKEKAESSYLLQAVYPCDATLWKNGQTPVNIPFADAVQLLKKYFEIYNTSNNKPAQNLSYAIRELTGERK